MIIRQACYDKLPATHQQHFEKAPADASHTHEVKDDDKNFGLSLCIGMATGSAALDYIAGESLLGAEVGEMPHEETEPKKEEFGGGSGGGGGAEGDFTPNVDAGPADQAQETAEVGDSGKIGDTGSPSDNGGAGF